MRAQLTACLALLVTLCLAAFVVYLYLAVDHVLTTDLDQTLGVRAQQIAATYDFDAKPGGGEVESIVGRGSTFTVVRRLSNHSLTRR